MINQLTFIVEVMEVIGEVIRICLLKELHKKQFFLMNVLLGNETLIVKILWLNQVKTNIYRKISHVFMAKI